MLEFPPHTSLCEWFVSTLPVEHAAISTLGDPFDLETVCSSDEIAAGLERMQLELGVGPCWQAKVTGIPALIPDLDASGDISWVDLLASAQSRGVRSTYAFPMTVGTVDVGVVDLFARKANALGPREVEDAWAMADVAALRVLDDLLGNLSGWARAGGLPKRSIHQATGMVMAQLGIPSDDALVVIRAHAFATGTPIRDIAEAIIRRDIDFSA